MPLETNRETGDVGQAWKLDCVKLVLAVDGSLGPSLGVLVTFGEKVHDISCGIDDWGAGNSNSVWDIATVGV